MHLEGGPIKVSPGIYGMQLYLVNGKETDMRRPHTSSTASAHPDVASLYTFLSGPPTFQMLALPIVVDEFKFK